MEVGPLNKVRRSLGGATVASGTIGTPEALGYSDPDIDRDEYEQFLQKGWDAARFGPAPSSALTVIAQDRWGLVHDVANDLSELGRDVEAASQATLAGFTVLTLVERGQATVSDETIRKKLSHIAEPDRLLRVGLQRPYGVVPDPTYERWNLHCGALDQAGILHRVTQVLADHGGILSRFVTLVTDDERCTVDLTVAFPGGSNDFQQIRAELDAIYAGLPEGQVDYFAPELMGGASSGLWLKANRAKFDNACFLSVVAEAKKGLVASLTSAMAEAGFNVTGSSMAVLSGYTMGIFAVAPDNPAYLEDSIRSVKRRLAIETKVCKAPLTPQEGAMTEQFRRVICAAAPGANDVLAKVTAPLASSHSNVERLRAGLTSTGSAFVVDALISLPLGVDEADLDLQLKSTPGDWITAPTVLPAVSQCVFDPI